MCALSKRHFSVHSVLLLPANCREPELTGLITSTTKINVCCHWQSQQVVTAINIEAVGQQLRMLQDQYKEKSKEYDRLYEKFNQTSQV